DPAAAAVLAHDVEVARRPLGITEGWLAAVVRLVPDADRAHERPARAERAEGARELTRGGQLAGLLRAGGAVGRAEAHERLDAGDGSPEEILVEPLPVAGAERDVPGRHHARVPEAKL